MVPAAYEFLFLLFYFSFGNADKRQTAAERARRFGAAVNSTPYKHAEITETVTYTLAHLPGPVLSQDQAFRFGGLVRAVSTVFALTAFFEATGRNILSSPKTVVTKSGELLLY